MLSQQGQKGHTEQEIKSFQSCFYHEIKELKSAISMATYFTRAEK
jgi:hypothetical protein